MSEPSKLVLLDFEADTGLSGWDSYSPFVLKVARALRFARLPFTIEHIAFQKIRALNPSGQLPVLLIDGEAVADSTRIYDRIEPLAEGSLDAGLTAAQKAEGRLWEELADRALYGYLLAARWADPRGWPTPRDAFFGRLPVPIRPIVSGVIRRKTLKRLVASDFTRSGLPACHERLERVLDDLDARAPEAGFWLGAHVTRADLSLFAQLHSLRIPHVAYAAALVAARPRLSAYLDRVDTATR